MEVVPGIWSVRRGLRGSASYIVTTSPGAILVDAGGHLTGIDVLRGLQVARIGVNSIAAILLTHAHRHAASGAGALRDRSGATVLCSAEEQVAPAAPAGWCPFPLPGAHVPVAVEADGHLAAGDLFEGLEVLSTPGHTAGHLSFFYRRARVLFTGDALRGAGSKVSLVRPTRSPTRAKESIRRCLGVGAALLLPCHGPIVESGALSEARDR